MTSEPDLSALHARYIELTRDRDPDDPELIEARRAWAVARFPESISEFVLSFPPMSEVQRRRIGAMLRKRS